MNTIGHKFRLTTFGESHATAMGGIIDGCPSQLSINIDLIYADLARRQGDSTYTTARHETNEIEFLSGILNGVTLGTPIAFIIRNKDYKSEDYNQLKDLFRPGHGDYTWQKKYGIRDPRGGGRASARETVSWVVAGSIAKQILSQQNISIQASIFSIGGEQTYEHKLNEAALKQDTLGGIIQCTVKNIPIGLGNPIFNKISAELAHAMMSIPSAIGFEMGLGFQASHLLGSQYIDQWNNDFSTRTNHCGGVQAGISNGMPLQFKVAFHPIVTLQQGIHCNDNNGNDHFIQPQGRHDCCQVLRAPAIVEALTAITILDIQLQN